MSLDEEEDDGPFAGGEYLVPGEAVDSGPQGLVGATAESSPIPVVVSGDGSASIDGIPVPVMGGESVDVAILDTLHGYARNRNASVRAAISDPSAGYVAIVEVAPDGSSKLIDQQHQGDSAAGGTGAVTPTESAGPTGPIRSDEPAAYADFSDDDDDDTDADADAHDHDHDHDHDHTDDNDDDDDPVPIAPKPPRPRIPTPTLSPALSLAPLRKKILRQSDDEYEPPSFLKRPLGVGIAGVVAAAVIVVPLVMLGSGSGSDDGQNQASDSTATDTETGTTPPAPIELTPSYSTSPSPSPSLSPSPSRSPSPSASTSAKPKPKPKTTARPKATAEAKAPATPKPHKETAAEAVMKLAARDPGRHICYRLYLSQDGWQKPVCDGTTAGRVGESQKIKSINTATAGTKGTASSAWVRIEEWKAPWNGSADGVDNYIGSTKADYPYILGFVINVGDGAVCQNAAVNGRWGGLACDQPTGQAPGNFIWGGTQDNSLWLQAVRFTV
ncbi:hypothetical protein ACFWP7_09395 [Streptomyces sp. NPDC058470]|uniref:hypothetical protein n=1 Tax=Streptomyces sp. NPDC058470 TaxID=3346515 RepID=UPI0036558F84